MPDDLFSQRPTDSFIPTLQGHLSDIWASSRKNWEKWESYYNQDFPVWSPWHNRPESRSASPSWIVDRATDTQLAYHPMVHRIGSGGTKKDEAAADAIEPWLKEALIRTMRKQPQHVGRQAGHYLMLLGYAALYGPVFDFQNYLIEPRREDFPGDADGKEQYEDALQLWENGREDWSPFILRAPHPSSVLLDPREKRPSYGILVEKRFAGDVFFQVEKRRKRGGDNRMVKTGRFQRRENPFEEIEVSEFFSTRWHALWTAEEGLIFTEPNRTGFVPLNHGFSGYGSPRSGGGIKPEQLAVGVLGRVEDDIIRQAQEVTTKHNILMNKGWAPMGTRGSAADIAEQMKQGGIIEGVERDEVWWLQFPDVGGDLFRYGQETAEDIEKGTFNLMAAGFREAGVKTLGEQEILSRATNLKFVAPREQMNDLFTIVGSDILRLVTFLGERIKVGGYEISPSKIGNRYSVDVTFEVVDPQLRLSEKQFAMTEYQVGLRSKRSYWALSGVENATDMEQQMAEDRLDSHPMTVTASMAAVAEMRGQRDLADRLRQESEGAGMSALQEMRGDQGAREIAGDETRPPPG